MGVVRRGDRFVGENTDGQGFLAALRTVVDPAGKALVVFGAGGAARAIAIEAALAGAASLTIVNRDPERGAGLVEPVNEKTPARADLAVWDAPYQLPATTSIVVNATSIGLFPQVEGRLNIELGSLEPVNGGGVLTFQPVLDGNPFSRMLLLAAALAEV